MSFSSSISGYFGKSTDYYSSTSTHLQKAGNSASKGVSYILKGTGNLFSIKNAISLVAGWKSYDFTAGKIISINAACQLENTMKKAFYMEEHIGFLCKNSHTVALALVESPVSSMVGIIATSIAVGNTITNPKGTVEAIRDFSEATYHFLESGVELAGAVSEGTLAIGLNIAEGFDAI